MLADQIRQEMTAAMKAGDKTRLLTLRMLVSELNYKKIELQRELTDPDATGVIQKEVKKRREAIDSYTMAGKVDQVEEETQEMQILEKYLPAQLSEEDIKAELDNNEEMKKLRDFGQMMRVAAPLFKGRAEGALVAKVVKQLCQ